MFLRVFFSEMFFKLQLIIGKLREWTTHSKWSRRLDIALLAEEKFIFSPRLNRLFTSNGWKILREKEAYEVFRD